MFQLGSLLVLGRTKYITSISLKYKKWKICGMLPTLKIFQKDSEMVLTIHQEGRSPIEPITMSFVKNDKLLFFCRGKVIISSKQISQILYFMRVLIQTCNCAITVVPLGYCTINNKSILLVAYMDLIGVKETRGIECLTIQFPPLPSSQSVGITSIKSSMD